MSESDFTRQAIKRLLRAWRGEVEAGYVYQVLSEREPDPDRSEILTKIAAAEGAHRRRIEKRLTELSVAVPDPSSVRISLWLRLQARVAPIELMLRAREAAEDDEVLGLYGKATGDPGTDDVLASIRHEERSHA
ncbi:MAG: ferritin family protein, partial [Candidatus Dormibacteraceae bacterium]